MTDEEKKKLSGSSSISESTDANQQTQTAQQAQTAGAAEAASANGTTASRTSTGTVLNYDPSADSNYQSAMAALEKVRQNAPSYTNTYSGDIAAAYSAIINRKAFSYDASTDPVFEQYKQLYTQQGKQAMRDTQGQAAALSGGYGSTYSQALGQQAYDNYIQRLNEIMPTLEQQAYERYQNEGQALENQYSFLTAAEQQAYDRYSDDYGHWYNEMSLARGDVNTAYERGVDDWKREYTATMDKASALAETGDFSEYAKLYGDDAAASMYNTWVSTNPLLAYNNGYIDAERYYSITGEYPPGYKKSGSGYKPQEETVDKINPSTLLSDARAMMAAGQSYSSIVAGIRNAAKSGAITEKVATETIKTLYNGGKPVTK